MTIALDSVSQTRSLTASQPTGRVLVLISGSVNFYYDDIGKRIAEALRTLGYSVDVATLAQYRDNDYDWCFIGPILEVCVPLGNVDEAMRIVQRIISRVNHSAMFLLECVRTKWFVKSWDLFRQANVQWFFDLGFHSQYDDIPANIKGVRETYHFAWNGLTDRERIIAQNWLEHPGVRPIPWASIGHSEPVRIQFVKTLMDSLDPHGFVYMPLLTHITENGPHMNGQHMQKTLERTRYFIWRTHHEYFYMESERFRNALLAGAVPVKVMDHSLLAGRNVPFTNLLLDQDTFAETLHRMDFESTRERFIQDFIALPPLETEIASFMAEKLRIHG
jgi:hypothetical protein